MREHILNGYISRYTIFKILVPRWSASKSASDRVGFVTLWWIFFANKFLLVYQLIYHVLAVTCSVKLVYLKIYHFNEIVEHITCWGWYICADIPISRIWMSSVLLWKWYICSDIPVLTFIYSKIMSQNNKHVQIYQIKYRTKRYICSYTNSNLFFAGTI